MRDRRDERPSHSIIVSRRFGDRQSSPRGKSAGVDIAQRRTQVFAVGLLPKNELFFDDFDKHTALIVEAAELLAAMTAGGRDGAADARRMKELEEQGDAITHRVVLGLRRAFITPLDRDDTHNLMSHLDDVLDLMEAAADRVVLFKLRLPQQHLTALAGQVRQSAAVIQEAVKSLRDKATRDRALELCVKLNELENQADVTLRAALTELLSDGADPILVIKWKEVFETLEQTTDRCEDVADVIENLLLDA